MIFLDLRGKVFGLDSPMTAISRAHGDYPIFGCLDALCDPNGGPAMIAWVLAFLGFPPPPGIPSIANRLVFCRLSATVRRCRSRREPMRILSENDSLSQ